MTPIVYLTIDRVVRAHAEALEADPGLEGIRSLHALAAAVGQAEQTFDGVDLYPSIPDKAAAYGYFLTQAHAFNDGNKRTATIAMLGFLELNGYTFEQDDEAMEEMFVGAAKGSDEDGAVGQAAFFECVRRHAAEKNTAQLG